MENAIQFIQVTPEQLQDKIVEGVRKVLLDHVKPTGEEKLLSLKDAYEFLGISRGALHNYTTSGKIKAYGIGNRVFYKRSELMNSLVPLNK